MLQDLRGLEEAHPELLTPDSPTQRVGVAGEAEEVRRQSRNLEKARFGADFKGPLFLVCPVPP